MKYQLSQYIRGILKTWDKNFKGSGVTVNPVIVEKDNFFEIQIRLSMENEPLNETKGIENIEKFNKLKKALNQRKIIKEKGFKMLVGIRGKSKNRTIAYYIENETICIVKNRDLKELGFLNGREQGRQIVTEIIKNFNWELRLFFVSYFRAISNLLFIFQLKKALKSLINDVCNTSGNQVIPDNLSVIEIRGLHCLL